MNNFSLSKPSTDMSSFPPVTHSPRASGQGELSDTKATQGILFTAVSDTPEFSSFQEFMDKARHQFRDLSDVEQQSLEGACPGLTAALQAYTTAAGSSESSHTDLLEAPDLAAVKSFLTKLFAENASNPLIQDLQAQKAEVNRLCSVHQAKVALVTLMVIFLVATILLSLPLYLFPIHSAKCMMFILFTRNVCLSLLPLIAFGAGVAYLRESSLADKIHEKTTALLRQAVAQNVNPHEVESMRQIYLNFLHSTSQKPEKAVLKAGNHHKKGLHSKADLAQRRLSDAQNLFLLAALTHRLA